MKDIPAKENIRTARQLHSDSDLFELSTGQVLTGEELEKLQELTDFFWIVVTWDKKLIPNETKL